MVFSRTRPWDDEGRDPVIGDLGDGGRAASRDHGVRAGNVAVHIFDERGGLNVRKSADLLEEGVLAARMQKFDLAVVALPFRIKLKHELVHKIGAFASPRHQYDFFVRIDPVTVKDPTVVAFCNAYRVSSMQDTVRVLQFKVPCAFRKGYKNPLGSFSD